MARNNPSNLRTSFSGSPVERMYFAWNDALSRNDAASLLALYAPHAVFESPLVPHLLGTESGVLHGREELRPLFDLLASESRQCGSIIGPGISPTANV